MFSDEIARKFTVELSNALGLDPGLVEFEIQDDWQFLLVMIQVPAFMEQHALMRLLKRAQDTASENLPSRERDYSWMINAMRDRAVVESVFGGNRSSKRSGELSP